MICADELAASPRTFRRRRAGRATATGFQAPLEYSRGPDKAWVYGALRVRDGQAVAFTARSRNTGYLDLLGRLDRANPVGDLYIVADDLSSHTSAPIRAWLDEHPRVHGPAARRRLLAQLPGGLVAPPPQGSLPPARPRQLRRDRARRDRRHRPPQPPRHTLGLGPPAAHRPPPTPRLYRRCFTYRL